MDRLEINEELCAEEEEEEHDREPDSYKPITATFLTICRLNPFHALQGYTPLRIGAQKRTSHKMCFRISLMLVVVFLVTTVYFVNAGHRFQQRELKVSHMTEDAQMSFCRMTDTQRFKSTLKPLLKPRVVGTSEHHGVQRYIRKLMMDAGFTVDTDRFWSGTPHGNKQFTNLIATYNPNAARRIVLGCHYESKIFPGAEFIGATDSAVPCAMLLDMAATLSPYLRAKPNDEVTLQMLFLDGEEAFAEWTHTDSLYGARHLAEKWEKTPSLVSKPGITTELDRIDVLVLLDLLGTKNPTIHNMFALGATDFFENLPQTERDLHRLGCLHQLPRIFIPGVQFHGVEDDHIPFLRRGVPILHLIPTPFPEQWHRLTDNERALDYPTIDNEISIIRVFVAKYLGLLP